jgi:hypothetical protein
MPQYLNIIHCDANNAWYLNTSRGILTEQQLFELRKFTHDIMFVFLYLTCKSVLKSFLRILIFGNVNIAKQAILRY